MVCTADTETLIQSCVFKPFCFLQGISSFLPARSHSSVSVALDRASSNSGSRVVTSSWRVSIGFCLGTNTLPVETEGKDDEERREGDDSALIKWRGNTLTSAKPEETGTCKSSAGFMRWYTNPAFYKKCWLMWLVILTLRPFLFYPCSTVIRLHDCQVLCDWECALKQMEPFQDKAAVSLIFTRRLELTPTLIRAPVTTHLIVLSVWHQTTHSSLSFTLKLVFSDLQVCDLACLFKSIEWLQCTGNQNISSCRMCFHFYSIYSR